MIIKQEGYPDFMASDYAEASRLYCERREQTCLGASEFPEAAVIVDGLVIARISYNGRIWPLGPWYEGMQPIYDNRIATD